MKVLSCLETYNHVFWGRKKNGSFFCRGWWCAQWLHQKIFSPRTSFKWMERVIWKPFSIGMDLCPAKLQGDLDTGYPINGLESLGRHGGLGFTFGLHWCLGAFHRYGVRFRGWVWTQHFWRGFRPVFAVRSESSIRKPQVVKDFSAWLCPLVGKIRVTSTKQLSIQIVK